MIKQLKHTLKHTWLFPRYIGLVHMLPALEQARTYVSGTMLDIGCGRRQYQPIFEQKVDRYIGVDWPVSLEHATPDTVADALHLPLPHSIADTVLATELMEHLPEPHLFLAEVARVLKPGGIFILSVPFLEPLHEEPRDFFRFTPYSLRILLEQHGFTVEQIWRRGGWGSVVIGSLVSKALYDWANPADAAGVRRNLGVRVVLTLPLCALIQFVGYSLDRFVSTSKYTLGYVVVARQTTN
ncbi:MAG: hypothetical protein RLZZ387_1936 [Chloroflexota bacterium]|jgi:SAM-dependent methyltransferase